MPQTNIIIPTQNLANGQVTRDIQYNPSFVPCNNFDVIRELNPQNLTLIVLN